MAAGEILVGVLLGRSGFDLVPISEPTLLLFSSIGFALVMLTAGSHVNFRALLEGRILISALKILLINFFLSLAIGAAIGHFTKMGNWPLLSLIMFSSSAAFVVPLLANLKNSLNISILIAQVTIADSLSFIALPFLTQSSRHSQAVVGALMVLLSSMVLYLFLKLARGKGWITRIHKISKKLNLGLELRISLGILLLISALALHFHSSIMVAGFAVGVVLATVGLPRRLARQLFAISDGFFAPLFFILLGASIDVGATFQSGATIKLAIFLTFGALIVHGAGIIFNQPAKFAFASAAQLGIPAAAVTLGRANGILTPGQAGAIMLAAILVLLIPSFLLKKSAVKK